MSSKIKWRESFQKARSQSQGSSEAKTSSLLEEGDLSVSDEELETYLGTLKKKSGVGRLWLGNTFDKIIDRSPSVSISSISDGEGPTSEQEKTNYSDNDFLPNILALPRVTEEEKSAASEASSIKPMEAVCMISDFGLSDGPLELDNDVKLTLSDHSDLDVAREVKSVGKALSEDKEPSTSDEVAEEIEEQSKHSESVTSSISFALSEQELHKKPSDHIGQRSSNSSQHSSHHRKHHGSNRSPQLSSRHHKSISNHSSSRPNSRKSSQKERTSSRKSDHSYTDDFSKSSKEYSDLVQETLHSVSSYTSSVSTKVKSKHLSKRKNHRSYRDASTQVNPGDIPMGKRLGVGMATLGPSVGHQYVDPSPIACHVVSADAVEALTVYNPAVIALTDMLRQQLRLVEQFVDNSRRMYESYTSNLNTTYNYTTLEDTMQYIQENEPFHRNELK